MGIEEKVVWIPVIQYVRPNGIKRKVEAPVREKFAKMAETMILSTEMTPAGVFTYCRFKDQEEEEELTELFQNTPDIKKVYHEITEKLIQRVYEKRFGKWEKKTIQKKIL